MNLEATCLSCSNFFLLKLHPWEMGTCYKFTPLCNNGFKWIFLVVPVDTIENRFFVLLIFSLPLDVCKCVHGLLLDFFIAFCPLFFFFSSFGDLHIRKLHFVSLFIYLFIQYEMNALLLTCFFFLWNEKSVIVILNLWSIS